jgi:hypothetical protein
LSDLSRTHTFQLGFVLKHDSISQDILFEKSSLPKPGSFRVRSMSA